MSPNETDSEPSAETYPKRISWNTRRYIVAILAFFGFFNAYTLRANLSMAIVAMTENKTSTLDNGSIISEPEFDWDSKIQGLVLSSFFYGYITTQLFGGWLSEKIGGKQVFGGGIAITAVLTLLTPWLAQTSVYLLLAVRIIEGIFQGVTYPSINSVWARWAPPFERTTLVTIAFSGSYVGTVVSMPASAYLAEEWGWPSIFYFFGVVAIIWYVIWWWFVAEAPIDDPRISKEELEYIQKSLGSVTAERNIKHPWKKILTSVPVWALSVSQFVDSWGFYTLLVQLPTYIKDMFGYDLEKTGFISGIPHLVMAIVIPLFGYIADWLQEKKILTTTQARKLFTVVGFLLHAIFLMGAAYWPSAAGAIVCLVLSGGLGVMVWSGWGVNALDIAPQHASVIMGISNTVGTLPGIFEPIVAGYIVTTPSAEEWQIVFCIASGLYVLGSIVYGIFGSGELQPWVVQLDSENGSHVEIREENK